MTTVIKRNGIKNDITVTKHNDLNFNKVTETTVIKRDGTKSEINFNKITDRLKFLCNIEEIRHISILLIVQKTIESIYPNITTQELDLCSADICAQYTSTNSWYSILGGRILVSNLRKNLAAIYGLYTFSDKVAYIAQVLPNYLNSDYIEFVEDNDDRLNDIIKLERDDIIDFFGFKTLERSYLIKYENNVIETPQDMFMRVAICIHFRTEENVFEKIQETYEYLSSGYFIHATPTLFNAGTKYEQCSSCYLLGTKDSLEGITKTWADVAKISKWAGGIGVHISNIRASGSKIKTTNGLSNGIRPMLKVYNEIGRYINQGGKRNGSIAIYLEPWHSDVMEFLELKLNTGADELRTRDLFIALWIPDLFMKQVEANEDWWLMTPDICTGLQDEYGDNFDTLYWKYVNEGKFVKKVSAIKIWEKIMVSLIETGNPYICFKDNVNKKSNHSNLGVIKSSNLCVAPETKILTSNGNLIIKDLVDQEVEVWNGTQFSKTIVKKTGSNQKLIKISFSNGSIIECTLYHKFYIEYELQEVIVEAQDLEVKMKISSFDMPDGITYCNILITKIEDNNRFDDTYCFNEPLEHKGIFNGILSSQCAEISEYSDNKTYAVCNLASIAVNKFWTKDGYNWEELHKVAGIVTYNLNNIIDNNFYPTPETKKSNLDTRPIGIGIQGLADLFYMMKIPFESKEAIELDADIMETIYHGAMEMTIQLAKENGSYSKFEGSPFSKGIFQFDMWNVKPRRYDWEPLRINIVKYGARNSLLTALMPTASTSQILGNVECFEQMTSNIYSRRTLAGNFMIVNKYLINELKQINLWNLEMKNIIVNNRGSIQNIDSIPDDIKLLYKTAWEIKQKFVIDHAIARSPYIDQSQSMNLFIGTPTFDKITSALFYGWRGGLKTGCYYLRSLPSTYAQQFSQEIKQLNIKDKDKESTKEEVLFCSLANPEGCLACGS